MSKKAAYTPQFKGPIEGYVVNFINRNLWRVASSMEFEDLMQEAHVVYLKLCQRYKNVDAPHFMALFKTSWNRRFTDLSHIDTHCRAQIGDSDLAPNETRFLDSLPGDLCHDGMLLTAIRQAPSEVQSVLYLFMNAPTEILDLASKAWRSNGHNRDLGNNMLCRMLGAPKGTDIVGAVQTYFDSV